MEKLIKIQSIINLIEETQGTEPKFRSKFYYVSENRLRIVCYCTDSAIGYYMILKMGYGYSTYIKDYTVEVIEHIVI